MTTKPSSTPVPAAHITGALEKLGIENPGKATIREIVTLVNLIEQESGVQYIRMEMGVPGLPPSTLATQAEIEALNKGVASKYPMLDGLRELKTAASDFVKAFVDLDISPRSCVPTVGAMQGSFINFLVCGKLFPEKDTILFIDPGFPVQKQQIKVLGYKFESFDVYHYRGEQLRQKMTSVLEQGNIAAIIYSNPNNPAWICLQENELQIIGELATQFDAVVIEDLAYFGMDFRRDISRPWQPPYQASVGRYTHNYVLLISSSKAFSYAGQRVAVMCISDKLFDRYYPYLEEQLGIGRYGQALVGRVLYSVSSGAGHSAQYALAAVFTAATEGRYNFLEEVKEYARRAKVMKRLFTENNFRLVYDSDMDQPLADGFYFTLSYPGMNGAQLLDELLYYGVSAITLSNTGSSMEGIRACVSQTGMERMDELEARLKLFSEHHRI